MELLLLMLLVLLILARVFAEIAERLHQPGLVGELVAGILLGLLAVPATKLSVLHVQHPGAHEPHMKMDAPDAVSEKDLRKLIRDAGHGTEADSLNVNIVKGDPYHESIAEATRDADLMIVGHSQRNAFVAALMNSVDERVANVADCPVVIVPKS